MRKTAENQQPSDHLTHPQYRSDIDGLRAIAVLSVVAFHAFPSVIPGGFTGVDIFFVISGFLISTIIYNNLERNSFSFIEFYGRRIKRIFPALFLVLAASFAFGWFALLADEYMELGKHIAAGAGFVSNIVLWTESGYFDNAAETKPLLHLWSLGIEEQYYIIWPLLLWLMWKSRFNLFSITVAVACLSFALNVWGVQHNPEATFYLPPTRFWELMVGSILAWITLHRKAMKFHAHLDKWLGKLIYATAPQNNGETLRDTQSCLGAGLIVAAVVLIEKKSAFPGWWALLPTLGAALMISAGTKAWLNQILLSNRVLVWFGLISYPLYLWHWPLLAFARIQESEVPAVQIRIAAVLLSIALAWLTYLLVEKPVRFGAHGKKKIIALAVLMLIAGSVGYVTYQHKGFQSRHAANLKAANMGQLTHADTQNYMLKNYSLCTPESLLKQSDAHNGPNNCFQSKAADKKDVALIGDSHAQHLFIGFANAWPNKNIVFYMENELPRVGIHAFQDIFNTVLNDKNIKYVILSSYWAERMTPDRKAELLATARALAKENKKLYIVDDVPDFSFNPRGCAIQRPLRINGDIKCHENAGRFDAKYDQYMPILEAIEKEYPGTLLKIKKYFCGNAYCSMSAEGMVLYRDSNHLNIDGSIYLGKKLLEANPKLFDQ